MEVIIILISVSVVVAGCFLWAFIWAAKSGQFDDDYTPGVRMLFDDDIVSKNKTTKKTKK